MLRLIILGILGSYTGIQNAWFWGLFIVSCILTVVKLFLYLYVLGTGTVTINNLNDDK